MTAERWAQIRQLYDAALEQPADREIFISEGANGDPELCKEVLAMLQNCSEDGGLLNLSLFGRQWVQPATVARMLAPGRTLAGRYRILRPIGAGGMGEVYEAEDLELGAHVAVKTMRVESADTLASFKREIHLARTVTHPNVCRIFDLHRHHDSGSGDVVTFLTMELIEGETLTTYLARRGPLTPAETLLLARQIGAALTAAHEKGVIHRDLKSGNVMLADNGQRAVVTDFGLAHTLTQATESSVTIAGTPAYMAPEQFEGKPTTAAVDVYAFGVLLYEMVVGRRPFAGDSPIALALDKIRKEPPRAGDAVPALPQEWSDTIRRCLDPDPANRFREVRDALNLLEASVDRPPLIRLSRLQKRIAASALVLFSAVGIAAWLYSRSTYTPASDALRLYRLGAHAQQLGLPWKASQLYEQALAKDDRFIGARASLAEAWMDLDQPRRAVAELASASAIRPRWLRVAEYEAWLERAAHAQLRGALQESADYYRRATALAPDSERPDLLMSEARAKTRAGDTAGAVARYSTLEKDSPDKCAAMLAHAALTFDTEPFPARRLLIAAENCFSTAGDLDGSAQAIYITRLRRANEAEMDAQEVRMGLSIAQSTGNVEQEILAGALLSRIMLDVGLDDDAYAPFSRSIQLAEQRGLKFMIGRLLEERAQYYFDKGDYLRADFSNTLAASMTRSAGMPWSLAKCYFRSATLELRMGLVSHARGYLSLAKEQLRQFPNGVLRSQLTELEALASRTRERAALQ
jgi:tetratricopeptide (TPR) repeat protein